MAARVFLAVDPALLGDPDELPLPSEENEHCQLRRTLERCAPPAIPVFRHTLDDGYLRPVRRHIVEHTSIAWPVPSTISAFGRPPSNRSSRLRRSRFGDTTL